MGTGGEPTARVEVTEQRFIYDSVTLVRVMARHRMIDGGLCPFWVESRRPPLAERTNRRCHRRRHAGAKAARWASFFRFSASVSTGAGGGIVGGLIGSGLAAIGAGAASCFFEVGASLLARSRYVATAAALILSRICRLLIWIWRLIWARQLRPPRSSMPWPA